MQMVEWLNYMRLLANALLKLRAAQPSATTEVEQHHVSYKVRVRWDPIMPCVLYALDASESVWGWAEKDSGLMSECHLLMWVGEGSELTVMWRSAHEPWGKGVGDRLAHVSFFSMAVVAHGWVHAQLTRPVLKLICRLCKDWVSLDGMASCAVFLQV